MLITISYQKSTNKNHAKIITYLLEQPKLRKLTTQNIGEDVEEQLSYNVG